MTARLMLALDASAGPASVALFMNDQLLQATRIDRQGSAELLAPTVAEVLRAAGREARELTDVIVGGGPGSFTGLRVAAALGKGLARGSGASLHAVPSLALIAAADDNAAPGLYIAVLDALRAEWFMQLLRKRADGRWVVLSAMERRASADVRARAEAEAATIVGPPIDITQQPDARAAVRVGFEAVDRDRWEPDYGRLAEAQVQWELSHSQPLPTA
jgi:tRNA threonylcarbamoyladenosine biosynthesis protein TsaB